VKWIAIGVKVGITGLLAWLLLKHVDFAAAEALLRSQRGLAALALAVAVLTLQAFVAALRTVCVMRLLGWRCRVGQAFAVWMTGLLIGQTLLTFVAGDAARIWQFARRGYARRLASSAIVLERAVGLVVLLALVLLCEPFLLARASSGAMRTGLTILALVCAGGIAAFAGSAFVGELQRVLPARLREHRLIGIALDIASVARHLTRSWKLAAMVILSSVLLQFGSVLAIFVLAYAEGVDLDFIATAAVVWPSMLLAMMPIALAGWGVREGAMMVGYGLFGVAPAAALAISIAFGVATLVASLPGAFFIRLSRKDRAAHAATSATTAVGIRHGIAGRRNDQATSRDHDEK
jgi:glycosyltransferase 2 family protein